jgi:sigma-B regulation protein RsbU (phosphoserine phosphatase)
MQSTDNHNARRNLSAIVDFSNNINSNLNLEFALNNLMLTCFGKLLVTRGIIALFDQNNELKVSNAKGINEIKLSSFPSFKLEDENFDEIIKFSLTNEFELVEKIISSGQLLGYILLGKKLNREEFTDDDKEFFSTILKIGSTTIRNALSFESLAHLNKMLDSKINQLNSIFDLGKEFSGILEIRRVSKLLVYAVSAQMLISKYAIVIYNDSEFEILESKYDKAALEHILQSSEISNIAKPVPLDDDSEFCKACRKYGIALIVPMMIKSERKGLIFLGSRITKQSYSQSDIEYISSIASFAIISIENARLFNEALEKQKLEKDLEIARSIQQNLLPKHFPKSDKFKISAINQTARKVGGDYYDVVRLDDDRILIAIADVSGKGVQASLLMANLQAFLKSIYKQNYTLPEASNFLNDLFS